MHSCRGGGEGRKRWWKEDTGVVELGGFGGSREAGRGVWRDLGQAGYGMAGGTLAPGPRPLGGLSGTRAGTGPPDASNEEAGVPILVPHCPAGFHFIRSILPAFPVSTLCPSHSSLQSLLPSTCSAQVLAGHPIPLVSGSEEGVGVLHSMPSRMGSAPYEASGQLARKGCRRDLGLGGGREGSGGR